MKVTQILSFSVLAGVLSACGSFQGSVMPFSLVGNGEVNQVNGTVSGKGSIVFDYAAQGGVASGSNIEFQFQMEDDGVVTLHTYSNAVLGAGVDFMFARVGKKLTMAYMAGGTISEAIDLSNRMSASGEVHLKIDVHNNESPAHIVIWPGNLADSNVNAGNAIHNSEEDHDHEEGHHHEEEGEEEHEEHEEEHKEFSGKGMGDRFGLTFREGTRITIARVRAPLFKD